MSEKIERKLSSRSRQPFIDWQKKVANEISSVLNLDLDKEFLAEHKENIVYNPEGNQDFDLYSWNIENNFLYALPKIVVYFYTYLWKDSKDLILSLLKYYQKITWIKIADIDWFKRKSLPRNFKQYCDWVKINEKALEVYMVWVHALKWAHQRSEKDFYYTKYPVHKMLMNSSIFRDAIEERLYKLKQLPVLEYLRKFIKISYSQLPNIESISERQWTDYLLKSAKKYSKFNEKLNKLNLELEVLLDQLKKLTDAKSSYKKCKKMEDKIYEKRRFIKYWKRKISQTDPKIEKLMSNLSQKPKKDLLKKGKPFYIEARCKYFAKKREALIKDNNLVWLENVEIESIHNIMRALSKTHMVVSDDPKQDWIPKNFAVNRNFTCFSGVWVIASLLMKSGIKEKDIYIIDDQESADGYVYKHSSLVVKVWWKNYYRIDYGMNQAHLISPIIRGGVNEWIIWPLNQGFDWKSYSINQNKQCAWFSRNWRIYKLTNWIMFIYLINLASQYIDRKDTKSFFEILPLLMSLDENNYDIYELMWLAYLYDWNKELSIKNFKKALILWGDAFSPISSFYCAKQLFEEKEYDKALTILQRFITDFHMIREWDKKMLQEAKRIEKQIIKIHKSNNYYYNIFKEKITNPREYVWYSEHADLYFRMDDKTRKQFLLDMVEYIKENASADNKKIYIKLLILMDFEIIANTKLKDLKISMWLS